MSYWLGALAALNVLLVLCYLLFWHRRRALAAYIYVYKGAIWFFWITSWLCFLGYISTRPSAHGFLSALTSPGGLAQAMFSLLSSLLALYLAYLMVVYPFFASLRPGLSKESLGIDWQLDIYVEDKVMSLVEDLPSAALLLLNMSLSEALRETPPENRAEFIKELWLRYLPEATNGRAGATAHLPPGAPDTGHDELDVCLMLAEQTLKVVTNQGEKTRRWNIAALPLAAGGRALIVLAAYWPRHKPFRDTFNLIAQQFCAVRHQYILAEEVTAARFAYYDDPWNNLEEEA